MFLCELLQAPAVHLVHADGAPAGVTPGYGDEVIFADGTFIDGSTSELSADGPIRPPYIVYCQGGTHWTHWALAIESALEAILVVHD